MKYNTLQSKVALALAILTSVLGLGISVAIAADGSGASVVSPTTATASSTGNTHAFTFSAAETMDSGELSMTVPASWTAPQGTAGTAGYTTVSTTGMIANVVNALNATTNWTATQHATYTSDTSDKQEGLGSLVFSIPAAAAAGDQFYKNISPTQNWGGINSASSNARVGFFIKSNVATTAGQLQWQHSSTPNLANVIDTVNIPALTANTWLYTSMVTTAGTTLPTIASYGLKYTSDIGAATIKMDAMGPIFDPAGANNWTGDTGITVTTQTSGQMEGTSDVRCTYANNAGVGANGDCNQSNATAITQGPGTTVGFWARPSIALNAGDFAYVDDGNTALASPEDQVNLPALPANVWTFVTVTAPNSSNKATQSFGIRQLVDKGAMTFDVDSFMKVIDTGDSVTGWTSTPVQALSVDTTTYHEGGASLRDDIYAGAVSGDRWYETFASTQDWSAKTTVGFWIRSSVATAAGNLQFQYATSSDMTSPVGSINIPALTANTWTYEKLTLSGTRTAIKTYGINYATDIGAATVWLDDMLIGPGTPTFPGGGVADVRLLSLASGQAVTLTYGSGGGASGATAPATTGAYTFTTTDRVSDSGTLTGIATSPVVTVNPAASSPTVTNITSSLANGTYKAGQVVPIQVTFNQTVIVTGAPQLTLSTGSPATTLVNYASGSGTNTITFNYTVAAGNASADLDYASISALILNSGTIKDATGTMNATLTLPSPGAAGSLGGNKDIIIDTTAPTLASVTPVPTPTKNTTPSYTFSSTEAGTITYGGSCSSATTSATSGNNTITFSALTAGTYSNCTITVTDAAGNISSVLNVPTFVIDTTAPTLAVVTPVSTPTSSTTPVITFSTTEAGTITYGGSCSSATTSATSGNNTITFNALAAGTYSNCTITVTDAAGNISSVLNVPTFVIDTTAPVLATVTPVPTPTKNTTPSYTFSSTEVGTIIYGGACSSATTSTTSGNNTITFNTLAAGTYSTCTIRVRDAAGNTSAVLTVPTFVIDTTAPTLAIVTPVVTPTSSTTPVITFSTTEAGTITYGGSCSSATTSATSGNNTITFSTLAAGTYSDCTITVMDAAGNISSVLSIPSFTIDTTAPTLATVTPVPTPTKNTTPSYTFSSTEAGTIVYGGSCSSATTSATSGNNTITFNTLAAGTYSTCTIRVRDAAGNLSAVLSIPTFVIDTTAPTVAIVTPVTTPTSSTTPVITFSSTEAGTITYGGSCSSATTSATSGNNTVTFSALAAGTYSNCTITVTDAAGNISSVVNVPSFTIDNVAPTLAIVTPVSTPTSSTTPVITFSSTEAGTITYGGSCSSATTSATSGNNTITFNTLVAGTYSNCTITVKDSAGNISSVLNVPTFVIDTTAPTLATVTPVPTPTKNTTPSYTFSSTEAGTIVYGGSCSSATTSATSGNNTITFNTLAAGTYSTCTIRVRDAAGNLSAVLTIPTFVIDTTAPTLASVTPVPTPTKNTTPSYTFSSTEAGTITYGGSCSSATTSATSGNNTITFSTLIAGTYSNCTITVTDAAGNISSALSVPTFVIDTTAPTLAIVTPVSTPTSSTTPVITFSTTEAGTITYGGSCSSATTSATSGNNTITFNTLAAGTYADCTITVTDAAGNISSVLSIPPFTIDTTAPTLATVTPVPTPTKNTTPSYTFSSTEAGTITYGGSCSSATTSATSGNNTITFNTLAAGTYSTCTIRVRDAAGNLSAVLTVPTFVIDTTAPTLAIVTPVSTPTSSTTPIVTFSTTEAGTITYGGSCSSATTSATSGNNTITFSALVAGTYSDCTITVTDAAGNISSVLSIPIFVIDTTAPTLATVTPVPTPTKNTTPSYTFSSTEAGTITYGGSCSSATTAATSGNNTITFNALIAGTYSTCTIRVRDAAGNLSAVLTVPTFVIDTTAPTLAVVTPVPTPTKNTTPSFTFSSTEAGTITYGGSCSATTTSAIAGNTTVAFSTLTAGTYSNCTITVTDAAGNVSSVLNVPTFVIDTTAPTLAVVTPVSTPTSSTTPVVTFSTTEAGTITYGGSCSSATTTATSGNNTVTFNTLAAGTYSNCTITVTDVAGNISSVLNVPTFVIDTTAPTLATVTPVPTPGHNTTPSYTFSSTEAGTITYGGSCSSATTSATSGNNTITFNTLAAGTYSTCTIRVRDAAGNLSAVLTVPTFVIDTTAPTLAIVTPVSSPTSSTTPIVTFSSTEAGTITYGGSCSSATTSATSGNNTITFSALAAGTYSDCTITVTDAAGNISSVLSIPSFTIDTTAPTLATVTPVPTPTKNTTPSYTFSSTEAGTIIYGGSCSSATTSATSGNNTITFNALAAGTYSTCTIRVRDAAGNTSALLTVPTFVIDTTAPTLAVVTPVPTPTKNTTPSFTFSSTEAGTITYGGSCSSAATSTTAGNKTVSFSTLAAGTYSDCTITVTDAAGNISSALSVPTFVIDTTAPTLAVVTPVPTPTKNTTPSFTFSSTEAGTITYGGSCSATTTSAIAGNTTVTFTALAAGTYSNCTITVTDAAGNISSVLNVPTFVIDTTAPVLATVTPVPTPTKNTTPSYTFSSTEAGTITYGGSCSASTTSAIAGNNTVTFNALAAGTYSTCTIRVTDAAGNLSSVLTVPSFVIDTTAPTLAVVTPVPTPTKNTTPSFTFSSTEAGTITYGGSCSATTTSAIVGNTTVAFSALAAGTYSDCTITVTDAAGNISSALSVPTFVIDTTAPVLATVTPVPTPTKNTTPSFTFSSTEAGTITYGGSCSATTTSAIAGNTAVTFSALAAGTYSNCTITVTDAAGNISSVLNVPTFVIDTTAPVLATVTPVPTPTKNTTPSYTFSSTEAGTITYGGSCSASTTAAIAGNNTVTFNALAAGTYSTCTIRVTDAAGNLSSVLTVPTFVIDTTAPTLAVVTPVPTPTKNTTPSFTFSSTEAGTITYGGSCSATTTSAIAGNTTVAFSALVAGTYSDCTITVTDAAGNISSVLTVPTFVIDTTAPVLAVVTPVATPGNDTTPDFTFSSTEAGTITYGGSCSSATTSATSGNNTVTFNTLAAGTYSTCTIRVTDAAGNLSSVLTVPTFVIDTTVPTLASVTPVPTPGHNTTPSYTFSSTEAGTITYGGSCSSATASATSGNNTVTFAALVAGTYTDCTITVTDAAGNTSAVLHVPSFTIDTTAPTLAVVTPVTTPGNDTTPDFTFSTTEAGTITYGGSCSSATTSATTGNNTVTFNALVAGTYSNCTITVTDAAGNISSVLNVPTFVIDTTAPVLATVTPVSTPTKNTTPSYTFSSTEAGTITYGGSCSSTTTSATSGNNTVTFNTLAAGTYSTCTITVTDAAGNVSSLLHVPTFVIDTTAPALAVVTPVPTPTKNTTPSFTFSSTEAGTVTYGGSCSAAATSTTAGNKTVTFSTLAAGTYSDCTITVTDAAGNTSSVLHVPTFVIDTTAPVLAVVTPVPTPTNNTTPSFTFSSTENGSITYGGSCSSATTSATSGNTTVTFSTLSDGTYTDCTITVTDAAGNTSSVLNVPSFTVDTTAPTVTNVTSPLANGTYKAGQVIPITITFSEIVNVTGTPALALATGSPASTAVTYTSGSGTNTLTFTYTVAAGNTSADLDYVSSASLVLAGGTIKSIAGNSAALTLPAPGAVGSLGANKNIVIDTTAPTLSVVTPVATPGHDVTPSFTFHANEAGTITYGGSCTSLTSSAISGNNTVTFATLAEGTYVNCTITVTDAAGNVSSALSVPSFTIDTTAPTLAVVTPVPTPGHNTTPAFTFSSTEAGSITYGGSCSSATATSTSSNNTVTFDALTSGTYSDCTMTVTDAAGNTSSVLHVPTFVIDTVAPVLAVVTPVPTPGHNTTPSFTFSSTEAGTIVYGGSCSASTTSATLGNSTVTFDALTAGTYSNCTITVTDAAGNTSSVLHVPSFTIDTVAPVLAVVTPVPTPGKDTTPSFTFSSTEAGTITYGGSCSSAVVTTTSGNKTVTFTTLAAGTYTDCTITVTDAAGNASDALLVPSFVIDTTAPTLAVVTPVPTPGKNTTPSFTFSSTEAGTIVYGGSCSSATTVATSGNNSVTFSTLAAGTYSDCTITVTDAAGNTSSVLHVPTFVIDTTAPVLAVVTPVPTPGHDTTPSFTFSSTEAGTITYGGSCSAAATSTTAGNKTVTFSTLAAGTYSDCTITVTDAAGNTSSVLHVPTFVIDTVAPVLAVVTPVPTPGHDTTPAFTFSSTEAGSITYGGSCSSATTSATSGNNTVTFDALTFGTYSDCTVTVTDEAGNSSSVLNVPTFVIDTSAPVLAVVTPVPTPGHNTTPSFTFSSTEAGTITYGGSCSASTTSATSGNNTVTLNALIAGTYSNCTITVTDAAGNVSALLHVPTFVIDTVAPTLAVVTPVPTPGKDTTPNFTFSSTEAGTITYGGSCSSADTSAIAGNNTETFSTLAAGTYSDCTITVTDAAGNISSVLNVPTFVIDTTAPVLAVVTPVPTPGHDTTPSFTFSSTEAGTITYGGSCSSATASATAADNTVAFDALIAGTYSNCTITVTDVAGNVSSLLHVPTFVIDTVAPTLAVVTPVPTPGHDTTPSFTFHSTEAGTITYGGSCASAATSAILGNITVAFNALIEGTYTDCTITVTDAAGNTSSVLNVPTFVIDTAVPTLAVVTPVPTPGHDTTPAFTFSSTEAGSITYGGSCSSATGSATSGNNTVTFDALTSGTYSDCTITVTDAAGNVSSVLHVPSFTIDTVAPVLAVVTPVPTPGKDTTPSFTFSSTEVGTITYGGSCSSATTSATSGNNTVTFDALTAGTYANCTITVTDAAGNTSSVLHVPTFVIDTVAPVLAVVTPVPTPGKDTTPSFTFSSTEAGTITYGGSCSAADVSAIFGNNTETFSTLAAGTYSDCTITVTDAAGNVSSILNVPSFVIDTTAPVLAVVTPVPTPGHNTTPGFTFSSTEAGTITYGGSCSSAAASATSGNNTVTFNALAAGTYTDCTVTVTDAAGNVSSVLHVPSFTIDTVAPVLAVVTPVPTPGHDTTPSFTFSSTEAGSITYGGSCSSATASAISGNNTVTFTTLASGTYSDCTITVTDAAGNTSSVLHIPSFTIDMVAPVLAVVTPVPTPGHDTTPAFTFSSTEAGSITYGGSCSSATGSATSGNNTVTFDALSSGIYTDCTITVTDAAGNVSSVLPVPSFTIDTVAPVLAVVTPVPTPGHDTTPSFTFSSTEAGSITYGGSCSSAVPSATTGSNSVTFNTLVEGTYTDCTITVTDAAGNVSSVLHVPSFTIDTSAPVLAVVTPVPTPGHDTTPSFTFSSTKAGTITYGGSCSAADVSATSGNNTVTFNTLAQGTYSDCTITVTDAAGNASAALSVPTFVIDTVAPVLAIVTPVPTPGKDTTPDVTFSSTEDGSITYGGSCSSATGSATSGNNTVTLNTLADGTYTNCTITVTDAAGNVSSVLHIPSFTIDTSAPVLAVVTPVPTPSNSTTPVFTFSSTKAGTITYGGSCASATTSATAGNTTVSFNALTPATYTDCTITVTDAIGNVSAILAVPSFTIFNPAPPAVKFVILHPSDATAGGSTTVTIQAQTTTSSIATIFNGGVTIVLGGSASVVGGDALVTITDGVGTVDITDHAAESVPLSLTDSQGTGLDVSSTETAHFTAGSIHHLVIGTIGNQVAGIPFSVSVAAKDQFGNTVTTFTGTADLSSSLGSVSPSITSAFVNGAATATISLAQSGTGITLTATKTGGVESGLSNAFDVSAGATKAYSLNDPGDMTAGTRIAYTVTRSDAHGNLVESGPETVYLFTSSAGGTAAFYDAATNGNVMTSVTIPSGQHSATFWYYDDNEGGWTISASDNASAPDGATGVTDATDLINVSAAPIVATRLSIQVQASATVGDTVPVTIRAENGSGQLDTTYTRSDNSIVLHSTGSATASGGITVQLVNGVGTVNISDTVAQGVTLSIDDTTNVLTDTATAPVTFNAGVYDHFVFDTIGTQVAGVAFPINITAKDQYGNTAVSFTGTTDMTTTAGTIAPAITGAFTAGVRTETVTVTTADTGRTITVTRTGGAEYGTSNLFDVTAGNTARYLLNDPGDMTAGTRIGYVVTRKDTNGNLVTSGTETAHLSSDSTGGKFFNAATGGTQVTTVTFANGSATANVWYTDTHLGSWVVTVSDNATPDGDAGIKDASDSVNVSAAPIVATQFIILGDATAEAGNNIQLTIKAVDANLDVQTSFEQDVTVQLSGTGTVVPGSADHKLVNIVHGVGTVLVTSASAGTVTASLADTQGTGLDVTATKDLTFTPVAVPQVTVTPPTGGGETGGGGLPSTTAAPLPTPTTSVTEAPATIKFTGQAFPVGITNVFAVADGQVPLKQDLIKLSNGKFSVDVKSGLTDAQQYGIVVFDKNGRPSQAKIFTLNRLTDLLKVQDLLISPTIDLTRDILAQGDFLSVIGYAAPGNTLEFQIDGKPIAQTTVVAANGQFKLLVNTNGMGFGKHEVRVRQVTSKGIRSDFSITKTFELVNYIITSADLNKDGQIDVRDFSIFNALWYNPKSPERMKIDLNGDGKVDVQDFSIFTRTLQKVRP